MLIHFSTVSLILAVIFCVACIACSIQVSFVWNLYAEIETIDFGNGFMCKTSFFDEEVWVYTVDECVEEIDSALPACVVLKNSTVTRTNQSWFHQLF
jgi:hypothetical protein